MKGNEEHAEVAGIVASTVREGRRGRVGTIRRSGLLAFLAAISVALAACSGGPSTPHVAALGASSATSHRGTTTTQPTGNATQLLDEWTTCIRSNGDPNQADPTIDSNKDIEIKMQNVSDTLSQEVHGSTGPCSNYLLAAENTLRDGQPAPQEPSAAQQAQYADCMRTHGVPNFPNPNPATGKTDFQGTGVDSNSPTFTAADKECTEQEGEKYYPPGTEAPGVVRVQSCNGPGGCPSGGPGGNGANIPRQTSPARGAA